MYYEFIVLCSDWIPPEIVIVTDFVIQYKGQGYIHSPSQEQTNLMAPYENRLYYTEIMKDFF